MDKMHKKELEKAAKEKHEADQEKKNHEEESGAKK